MVRPTTPALTDVEGTWTLASVSDTSDPSALGFRDDDHPDQATIDAAAQQVAELLDTYLTGAQAGTADLALLDGAWLTEVDPETATLVTAGLADAEHPITAASYAFDVQVEEAPTIITAVVRLERWEADPTSATFVFDVTAERPTLALISGGPA